MFKTIVNLCKMLKSSKLKTNVSKQSEILSWFCVRQILLGISFRCNVIDTINIKQLYEMTRHCFHIAAVPAPDVNVLYSHVMLYLDVCM